MITPKRSSLSLVVAVAVWTSACRTTDGTNAALEGLEAECGDASPKPPVARISRVIENHETPIPSNRKPIILYVAVDTEEPFMQLAVRKEVHDLAVACAKSDKVSWIVLTNSEYVHHHRYFVCKNKKVTAKTFPKNVIDLVSESLDEVAQWDKREPYPKDPKGHNPFDSRGPKFVRGKDYAKVLSRYPIALPQAVKALQYHLLKVELDNKLVNNPWVAFQHFKSHGADDLGLSGLTEAQMRKKTECQLAIIKKYGTPKMQDAVSKMSPEVGLAPEVGLNPEEGGLNPEEGGLNPEEGGLNPEEGGLGAIGLGDVGLGSSGLGAIGPGSVGLSAGGFGVGGLSSENYFGLTPIQMAHAWEGWFEYRGFIFTEACHAGARLDEVDFRHWSTLGSYYFPTGTVWYRNIDYQRLIDDWLAAGGSPEALRNEYRRWASKVPNY